MKNRRTPMRAPIVEEIDVFNEFLESFDSCSEGFDILEGR